jgi:hypothetical protein
MREQLNRIPWLVGACAAAWTSLGAQNCRSCTLSDSTPASVHTRVYPALGLRVGTPQKVSAALGVMAGMEWQVRGKDYSRYLAAFVEPGLAGARASAGYVKGVGDMGSGYGIFASVLRTFDDSWTLAQNSSFVGGEVVLWPIVLAGPRIGVFRRVHGSAGGGWYLVADFGLGL